MLDLLLKDNAMYGGYHATKKWKKRPEQPMLFLHHVFDDQDLQLLQQLNKTDNDLTLFVVSSEQLEEELKSLGIRKESITIHVGEEEETNNHKSRDSFIAGNLCYLSSHGKPLMSLPLDIESEDIVIPRGLNIGAGSLNIN